jgi:RNA polymerase sigma-70 factor (ECF subfamily)
MVPVQSHARRPPDPAGESGQGLPAAPLTPEHVCQAHGPRVYSLARRMVGQEADAEDVAQEVLLQVVRKLGSFRGEAELSTWLHRVTVNAALLHRRRRSRRAECAVGSPPDLLHHGCANAGPARFRAAPPEQEAIRREARQIIDRALAGLPPIYREVFVLADVERLSNAEVGHQLGLRLPAVKSRLRRARLLMRDALAPYFGDAPAANSR